MTQAEINLTVKSWKKNKQKESWGHPKCDTSTIVSTSEMQRCHLWCFWHVSLMLVNDASIGTKTYMTLLNNYLDPWNAIVPSTVLLAPHNTDAKTSTDDKIQVIPVNNDLNMTNAIWSLMALSAWCNSKMHLLSFLHRHTHTQTHKHHSENSMLSC